MNPADTGPPPATTEDWPATLHIACEVCHEHLLVAIPRRAARFGAVACPECGSSYVFSVGASARR